MEKMIVKPEAIIFDLDGTLADTLPMCVESFQEALEFVTGKRPTKEQVMAYFGQSEEGITQAITPDNWEETLHIFLDIYEKNHNKCDGVFDGIIDILDNIKNNGYKMAMVTGKGAQSAQITLDKFGIKHYFEYVETGSRKGSIKPECIKRILSNWKIPADNVYYVGDSPTDIIDSKQAGVKPIAVSWASTSNAEILDKQKPYLHFKKITDFAQWINNF